MLMLLSVFLLLCYTATELDLLEYELRTIESAYYGNAHTHNTIASHCYNRYVYVSYTHVTLAKLRSKGD